MDPYTEKLLERTRQRRELLNQKLGKTPDPAPRKRVLEDSTNIKVQPSVVDDDSPKRQCLWETDGQFKPDTPAIPGVKSRLHGLTAERMNWSDVDVENASTQQTVVDSKSSTASSPVNRKSRFAQLAQNLDNFECDMSHPSIKKPEEKKPRWQPPKGHDSGPNKDARDRHVSSPRKEYEQYQGPKRGNNTSNNAAPSPKKKEAPAPPLAPPTPNDIAPTKPPRCPSPQRSSSPKKTFAPGVPAMSQISTKTVNLQLPQLYGSPKFSHQVKQVGNQMPVNARARDETVVEETREEPTAQPVTARLASWKKTVDTPNKDNHVDPTQLPLSERFAGWEQRVSQTPKMEKSASSRVTTTPKQMCTPARDITNPASESDDPACKPVSDIRATWKQQDAKHNPPKNEEPTAYSVSDRMSAWEVMSSSNKVSSIKKVDPGSSPKHSPTRPVSNFKPSGTPNKVGTWKPSGTPPKGLTPQKSFKEIIEERASQMGRRAPTGIDGRPPVPPTSNNRSPANSPSKLSHSPSRVMDQTSPKQPLSPSTVGSATKSLQQKLFAQVQNSKTDQLAEKIRQERMAEVNALNNRFTNGVLKDNHELQIEPPPVEQTCPPPAPQMTAPTSKDTKTSRRETIRSKAREEFNNKLQAMGFEISDEGGAAFNFKNGHGQSSNQKPTTASTAHRQPSSASKKPSSIYRLVSKKCTEEERPVVRQQSSSSLKKVTFEAHNTSTESDSSLDRNVDECVTETDHTEPEDTMDETEDDHSQSEDNIQSETQESFDDSFDSMTDSSIPDSYKGGNTRECHPQIAAHGHLAEEDDVSMSAFVPASVRRESVLPSGPVHDDTTSITSEDSLDYNDHHSNPYQSSSNLRRGYSEESGGSDNTRRNQCNDETTDDSEDDNDAGEIDDLLDEAMDDISEVEMRKKEPQPAPRIRRSHMYATTEGEMSLPPAQRRERHEAAKSDGLAYSVSMYRNNRMSQEVRPASLHYTRNSQYTHSNVEEEDIQMPTQMPPEVQRKNIQERIKELQELVSQEQSVIMQTSNALNKCCSGDSQFAGSAEQVECNRLLLVSCQRRQAYLMEMQRLKETGRLEADHQQGPKGSLTISDIRLPLKKDFVTKIGTASDTTVHYFVMLIRNGPQVILTQMLSTHDPMMRGSLDFPNLIKIHGISAKFNLTLEIYSMSVSREAIKDKKRKTPKKHKGSALTMESPGGPMAVRTTSFTQITSLPVTMKCLDKNSFSLERIPFLCPLHGMIYMRLKCMMEQNVEERGFLTMFEDVSGLGSWHRRWCVLTGNKMGYWKYPDDETRKDPMGFVDLKRVITEKIGLIPRDICARPHTFELAAVRPPRRGEQDTLVTKTYNTMTTTRFMLSADTKEERIVWCNKINRALANLRTWHADAMRPIKSKQ